MRAFEVEIRLVANRSTELDDVRATLIRASHVRWLLLDEIADELVLEEVLVLLLKKLIDTLRSNSSLVAFLIRAALENIRNVF